jgi:hypothetical protein
MAGLIPPVTGVAYQIEGTNLDNVVGFDALLLAIQPFMGNFEKYFMGSGIATATFVERSKVTLTVNIGGAGSGTVTIDSGSGPVAVNDGDILVFDQGTSLTVAANADATFNVTNLNCPFGQGTGVGTPSANCAFDLFGGGGATVGVDFN